MSANSIVASRGAVPVEHKRNFWHLYMDIMWYGVLSGSSIAFTAVFATRQGASTFQIGLLSATPAIMTLMMALPAGAWMQKHSLNHVVFGSAVVYRLFYLLWVFLPVLFAPAQQVWWLIILTFLMSVPGTALAIGFNGLFASAVPPEWRPHVAGIRNALLAISSVVVSFVIGWVLETIPFVQGYQVVFGIGFLGALMSTVHLWFVRPLSEPTPPLNLRQRLNDWAQPGLQRTWSGLRLTIGLRTIGRAGGGRKTLQTNVLSGRFRTVLLLLFLLHLAQYTAIPVFPLYTVNELQLSDQVLSWGNMFFYAALFFGSTQLARISGRLGNHRTLAAGVALMSLYPLIMAFITTHEMYYVTSVVGGLAWSLAGGAIANYLLDEIPEDNRAPYLAWYNLALHAAILLGSLIGPLIGNIVGLGEALLVGAILRMLAGLFLWRWGGARPPASIAG